MHGFAALDFRPRQRYTADKAASDKAAAAFDNILLYFTPVQSYTKFGIDPERQHRFGLPVHKWSARSVCAESGQITAWLSKRSAR